MWSIWSLLGAVVVVLPMLVAVVQAVYLLAFLA
jgi:hypothetical protein